MTDTAPDYDDEDPTPTRPEAVTRALDAAVNALVAANNDNAKLLAVRNGAKALAQLRFDVSNALGDLSDLAIAHDLAPNAVQDVLADGVTMGEAARPRNWVDGDEEFVVLPDDPTPQRRPSPIDPKAKNGPKPNGKTHPRLTLIWLKDIKVDDEPVYVVEGIIPTGPSLGETIGKPKSLKTFGLQDIFMHIAIGKDYGGRKVQQGAVVYVTSEGVRGVMRRLAAMKIHHGVDGKDIPFALVPAMPNLGTGTDDLNALIELITAAMPPNTTLRAVAVDTMRKATPGKGENDSKDMSVFLENILALSVHFNCHVNIVHHTPRSSDGHGSGSNAIDGAMDVIMSATRCNKDDKARSELKIVEMRDGDSEGDVWKIELGTHEIGKYPASKEYPNGKIKTGAYAFMIEKPARKDDDETEATVKLSHPARIALAAPADALNDVGVPPPSTEHIPRSIARVVTAAQWRDYAYRREISTGELRARQKAFAGAQKLLQSLGRVGCWDDHIWLVLQR